MMSAWQTSGPDELEGHIGVDSARSCMYCPEKADDGCVDCDVWWCTACAIKRNLQHNCTVAVVRKRLEEELAKLTPVLENISPMLRELMEDPPHFQIARIKTVRANTGLNLKDSKKVMDALNDQIPTFVIPDTGRRCVINLERDLSVAQESLAQVQSRLDATSIQAHSAFEDLRRARNELEGGQAHIKSLLECKDKLERTLRILGVVSRTSKSEFAGVVKDLLEILGVEG